MGAPLVAGVVGGIAAKSWKKGVDELEGEGGKRKKSQTILQQVMG